MPNIEVTVAPADRRDAFENLMQLYAHDFSEFGSARSPLDLDEDGRFAAYPMDAYWREAHHVPLLIRADGRLAGFALLNAASHSGAVVERNMAEFFIARKHRRGGVGREAAHAIFSRYPGTWEAAVARRNLAALAFWRKAVASHPLARDVEEVDVTTPAWDGPILRFRV
jgi:predicted acetyltransferase